MDERKYKFKVIPDRVAKRLTLSGDDLSELFRKKKMEDGFILHFVMISKDANFLYCYEKNGLCFSNKYPKSYRANRPRHCFIVGDPESNIVVSMNN